MLDVIVLRSASKFAVYFEYENPCIFFLFHAAFFSTKPLRPGEKLSSIKKEEKPG